MKAKPSESRNPALTLINYCFIDKNLGMDGKIKSISNEKVNIPTINFMILFRIGLFGNDLIVEIIGS